MESFRIKVKIYSSLISRLLSERKGSNFQTLGDEYITYSNTLDTSLDQLETLSYCFKMNSWSV